MLPDDWWTVENCAEYLNIKPATWRSYVSRLQAPPADRKFGRSSVWRPETIRRWRRKD